ncbi:DgyrCDS8736 [Dimorphilus gyrociliatus]|uniref:DgyrCDS8736 n=1 Tax=Dimorphilus gyrociliatus TaxID=2664684 RepID=A0A7I8VWI2_9ANNE|nr:DgyrCDS8736 [Dimorphilus gyrociliatus]
MDCMNALCQITSYEQKIQTLSTSLDETAIQLSPETFPAGFISDGAAVESSTLDCLLNNCIFGVRESWDWLCRLNYCLQIHLSNNAYFHQFYHELHHIHHGFNTLIAHLQKNSSSSKRKESLEELGSRIREVTKLLLNLQIRVNDMRHKVSNLVPVHARQRKLEQPIPAMALIDYEKDDIKLAENEYVMIEDNTGEKWKIRKENGVVAIVPSLIILIPAPNKSAVDLSKRTNDQLRSLWKTSIKSLQDQLTENCIDFFKSHPATEAKLLVDEKFKGKVFGYLNDMEEVLRPVKQSKPYDNIKRECKTWRQNSKNNNKKPTNANNKANMKLKNDFEDLAKVLKCMRDLKAYSDDKKFLIKDNERSAYEQGPIEAKYVAKAYVQQIPDADKHCLLTLSERAPNFETPPEEEDEPIESESEGKESEKINQQTIKETKHFIIVGVIHPRTKQRISMHEALNKGVINQIHGVYVDFMTNMNIPIPEAMDRGLIIAEFTDSQTEVTQNDNCVITLTTTTEIIDYTVLSVTDTSKNEKIPLEESVRRKIINKETSEYLNLKTGKKMSISSAIDQNLIQVLSTKTRERLDEADAPDVADDVVEKYIEILKVFDPTRNCWISLKEAIDSGLFNDELQYIDSLSNEFLPLSEAIVKGNVKARIVNDPEAFVLKLSPTLNADLLQALESNNPSRIALEILKEDGNFNANSGKVRDTKKGQSKTIREAITSEILHLDEVSVEDTEKGKKLTLVEAAVENLVDYKASSEILNAVEKRCLANVDLRSNSPECVYFERLSDGMICSVASVEDGIYLDGRRYSLEDVINSPSKQRIINPKIESKKLKNRISGLRLLDSCMDTSAGGIKDTLNKKELTVKDAVLKSVLDIPQFTHQDTKTGKNIPIHQAIKEGKISQKTGLKLLDVAAKNSLNDYMKRTKPVSDTESPLEAVAKKLNFEDHSFKDSIDPKNVFVMDQNTGVVSLGSLVDDRRLDTQLKKYYDPKTGDSLSLEQAIRAGLIQPQIKPGDLVEKTVVISDIINNEKAGDIIITLPDGRQMPLKEALEKCEVDKNSKLKIDSKSGRVVVVEEGATARNVSETKAWLNWLNGLKDALDEIKDAPLTTIEEEKQESILQGVLSEFEEKKNKLEDCIKESQSHLDSAEKNKDQHQLQYNVAELKRNAMDLQERLALRSTDMENLKQIRLRFYQDTNDLLTWCEKKQDELNKLKLCCADLEHLEDVQDFIDGIGGECLEKANDLQSLKKVGKTYSSLAKSYQSNNNNSPSASTIIENEIVKAHSSLENVVSQCNRLSHELSDAGSKHERYIQLRDTLVDRIPRLQKQVNDFSLTDTTARNAAKLLERLKAVTSDIFATGKMVEDIEKIGSDLLKILSDLDCENTPKGLEIKENVELIIDEFNKLKISVDNKQEELANIVNKSRDSKANLEKMEKWIDDEIINIKNDEIISLDPSKLFEEQEKLSMLKKECMKRRAILDSSSKNPDVKIVVSHLDKKLDKLDNAIDNKILKVGEFSKSVSSILDGCSKIDLWISSIVKSVKRSSNPSHEKIDKLRSEKNSKQAEIDNIKRDVKKLTNDPQTLDEVFITDPSSAAQAKLNELSDLLLHYAAITATGQIDDHLNQLEDIETHIQTVQPISLDPESLQEQLDQHEKAHKELQDRKKSIDSLIDICSKLIREAPSSEEDTPLEMADKIAALQSECDLVNKMSDEKLSTLREAVPLATHFTESLSNLQNWIKEVEGEIKCLDIENIKNANPHQVKKVHENAKSLLQSFEDNKPLLDGCMKDGQDLIELCLDDDAIELKKELDSVSKRYNENKQATRDKLNDIEDIMSSLANDLSDNMDNLSEDLHSVKNDLLNLEPISVNTDAIKERILGAKNILDDVDRKEKAISSLKNQVADNASNGEPDMNSSSDGLIPKLNDLEDFKNKLKLEGSAKLEEYQNALGLVDDYQQAHLEAIQVLTEIYENLQSQDIPSVEPDVLREQQKELEMIKSNLMPAKELIKKRKDLANKLIKQCGNEGEMEIRENEEEIKSLLESINDDLTERDYQLSSNLGRADDFENLLASILEWLPKFEHQLAKADNIAADPRSVRIQIEELKVLKAQIYPKCSDIQDLIQYSQDLRKMSPFTAESLQPKVKNVTKRWSDLLKGVNDREGKLKDSLVAIGELDHSLDDILGQLQQTEADLQEMGDVYGDPRHIESQLRKLRIIDTELKTTVKTLPKLQKAIDDISKSSGQKSPKVMEKMDEIKDCLKIVQSELRNKRNNLQDTLREIKCYLGDVDDYLRLLAEIRFNLKTNSPLGATLEGAERQAANFEKMFQNLRKRDIEVEAILLRGSDILDRCNKKDGKQIKESMNRLRKSMYDTRDKAERRRIKIEEHLENVRRFYLNLEIHTGWLDKTELHLKSLKHPSKLVERCGEQILEHESFKRDIETHRDVMQNLDQSGTYLKYFGRKADTIRVKNLLIEIRLRWKKLVRKADERGRRLQQAFQEDKRFDDSWRHLCDWISDSEDKLRQFASNTSVMSGNGKEDSRENTKESEKILKHFQHELSSIHPVYYSTMRLGRSLKERCTKEDPERKVLSAMLEELKNKWSIIRSIAAQRQNKLDEALLNSGRIEDAMSSLADWLSKAEAYLAPDQPTMGDLETVSILVEHHKAFEEELETKESVVSALQALPDLDESLKAKLDDLAEAWKRVKALSRVRVEKLKDAVRMAEDLNETVQKVRDWLPRVEHELKFKTLPDDENAIITLMDNHEKLREELKTEEAQIERIRDMTIRILENCHPNAVRCIKYFLTITSTRWDQAISRCAQRSSRLQEALRAVRGNAAIVAELLAWVSETQTFLATKEKDTIPQDLTVVEALLKEHMELHDELSMKQPEVEKATKLSVSGDVRVILGSSKTLHTDWESPSQRALLLANKWRAVWRISVDRKKRLQDCLDALIELESFKNFDFDLWRKRYINWIKAQKLRITDFFRRQDKKGDGLLSKADFVDGMMASKFPTNRTELNAVFDIFDRDHSGELDYTEFIEALRPDRIRTFSKKRQTDAELVHDEIEQQVVRCQCRRPMRVDKIGDGKYKFGEKQKICLVRFLNNTVMVRVGGGWVTLAEYLEQNDPCRSNKITSELRESFVLPNGSSQTRSSFTPKRQSSTPRSGYSSGSGTPTNLSRAGSTTSLSSGNRRFSTPVSLTSNQRLAKSCANLNTSPIAVKRTFSNDERKNSRQFGLCFLSALNFLLFCYFI